MPYEIRCCWQRFRQSEVGKHNGWGVGDAWGDWASSFLRAGHALKGREKSEAICDARAPPARLADVALPRSVGVPGRSVQIGRQGGVRAAYAYAHSSSNAFDIRAHSLRPCRPKV